MGPLVLIGKDLVLGGKPSKIEVIWVPGFLASRLQLSGSRSQDPGRSQTTASF